MRGDVDVLRLDREVRSSGRRIVHVMCFMFGRGVVFLKGESFPGVVVSYRDAEIATRVVIAGQQCLVLRVLYCCLWYCFLCK